jgi:Putative MetA-pathway of phenol degradation
MRRFSFAVGCVLLAAAASAEPFTSDRPGVSNPPGVIAAGAIQFEGGLAFERETHASDPTTNSLTVPEGLLRVGVLSWLEVRASADGFVLEARDGDDVHSSGSDFSLGSRARLFDQKGALPATALEFDLSIPTGSGAVTSDGVDPSGLLLFEWIWSERFTLDANLGLGSMSLGEQDSRRALWVAPSLSLGASLGKRTGVFVEYYAVLIDREIDDEHSFDGGFSWLIGDNLQLDISAGAGLNHAAPDFFVSAGAAWRFRLF